MIIKREFVLFSVFFVGIAKFEWAELFNAVLMATLGVFAGLVARCDRFFVWNNPGRAAVIAWPGVSLYLSTAPEVLP